MGGTSKNENNKRKLKMKGKNISGLMGEPSQKTCPSLPLPCTKHCDALAFALSVSCISCFILKNVPQEIRLDSLQEDQLIVSFFQPRNNDGLLCYRMKERISCPC